MTTPELARFASLQPHVAALFLTLKHEAKKMLGYDVFLVSGNRTFAEQNELYQKGRTTRGPKVTNAKPGASFHNFGLAFDVAIWTNGKLDYNIPSSLGANGEAIGLEWGGRWQGFTDLPHFQYTKGLTLGACNTRWPGGWKVSASTR